MAKEKDEGKKYCIPTAETRAKRFELIRKYKPRLVLDQGEIRHDIKEFKS